MSENNIIPIPGGQSGQSKVSSLSSSNNNINIDIIDSILSKYGMGKKDEEVNKIVSILEDILEAKVEEKTVSIDNIKLRDAGKISELTYQEDGKREKEKYYESIYMDTSVLPELSGKEVGEKVIIVCECSLHSHSLNENEDGKKEDYCLKIKKIGVK